MSTEKKPLWQEIESFSKKKKWIALGLIVLGISGLVLPVIPGLLLIGIAVFILKPEWYHRFRDRFLKQKKQV
jgi:hypothetical protein